MNFDCECGGLIINGKDSHCMDCIRGFMELGIKPWPSPFEECEEEE